MTCEGHGLGWGIRRFGLNSLIPQAPPGEWRCLQFTEWTSLRVTMKSPATKQYILIGLPGIVTSLLGCTRKAAPPSNASVVYTALPIRRDLSIYFEWIGTTMACVDADMRLVVSRNFLLDATRSLRMRTRHG